MIKVVCGIISNGEKILICRRNKNKNLSGYWEFPGGKIEKGEDYKEALRRELKEELGMKVEVGEHFHTGIFEYPTFKIELTSYKCLFIKATYIMSDHDKYEWVKVKQLNDYKLAPADIPIVYKLLDDNISFSN